jgi:hypothetical protein
MWSVPKDAIFQSSDHRSGAEIGLTLKEELRKALGEAHLVLLIFTDQDADWQFCMWETGVATDPHDATPSTRIAVFQAGMELPRVFNDEVIFKMTKDDIRRFVHQFHTTKGFYLKDAAHQKDVDSETLEQRASLLFSELKDVIPEGKREERYRWDNFQLWISPESTKKIKEATAEKRIQLIQSEGRVRNPFGSALYHFGYTTNGNLSLSDLQTRWLRNQEKNPNLPKGWILEICEEIGRAIDSQPAVPPSELMLSCHVQNWWFYPIVNHARVMPDGSFEFEIYLYRLPDAFVEKIRRIPDLKKNSG